MHVVSKSTDFFVAAKYILLKSLLGEQIVKLIVNFFGSLGGSRFPRNRFAYSINSFFFFLNIFCRYLILLSVLAINFVLIFN